MMLSAKIHNKKGTRYWRTWWLLAVGFYSGISIYQHGWMRVFTLAVAILLATPLKEKHPS